VKPPIPPVGTAVEPTAHAPDADTLREEPEPRAVGRRCPRCGRHTDAARCPTDGALTLAEGEPPQATLPTVGQRLCERYRLDRLLGRGAMGAVYAAHDLSLDRAVAVKLVRAELAAEPKVLERFHREAEALARLSHGAIVPLLDYGIEPATHDPQSRQNTPLYDAFLWPVRFTDNVLYTTASVGNRPCRDSSCCPRSQSKEVPASTLTFQTSPPLRTSVSFTYARRIRTK
jgi:serine/threonine protein kinase